MCYMVLFYCLLWLVQFKFSPISIGYDSYKNRCFRGFLDLFFRRLELRLYSHHSEIISFVRRLNSSRLHLFFFIIYLYVAAW